MTKSKFLLAAMSLGAAVACVSNAGAQYTPLLQFYTAGSSAQFNTFGIAASNTIGSNSGPLCGSHHWSKKNSSALPIYLFDPRSASISNEGANVWVAWDDNAANGVANAGVVCFYASVDSIVGVRAYMAHGTLQLASGLVGQADATLVPLLQNAGEALPQSIYNIINGAVLNAANTDIRPEDAKFASMRTLTKYGNQVTGRAVTGVGAFNGVNGQGASILSSQSTATANPVDFAIDGGDVDPVNSSNGVRQYFDVSIGAAPVMVIANVSNTASGHLGDGTFTNVNRFVLARALEGKVLRTRDLNYTVGYTNASSTYTTTAPEVALNVFVREPLSGTYNTMEFSIPNALEIDGTTFNPGTVNGQETGIDPNLKACVPTSTSNCNAQNVESGNPLFHKTAINGFRARAVGTGEMVTAVNNNADSIGYAFWGFSTFAGKTHLKYLTVDGVDPLYAGATANPNGVGVLPSCTSTLCPTLPFTNVINGSYPIWSKYRLMWDPQTFNNNIASTIVTYAQKASEPGTSSIIYDMLPATLMQVFHSHYAQVVRDSGAAYGPNNGFKPGIPETGGDMGGAVLTIQSELDFINDTGGNQQVQLFQ
jgi:hypothetical protein